MRVRVRVRVRVIWRAEVQKGAALTAWCETANLLRNSMSATKQPGRWGCSLGAQGCGPRRTQAAARYPHHIGLQAPSHRVADPIT